MSTNDPSETSRRQFLKVVASTAGGLFFVGAFRPDAALAGLAIPADSQEASAVYDPERYLWAYAVDTTKCIGCGSCMRACRAENKVPDGYYRTWVERYEVAADGEAHVSIAPPPSSAFETDGMPETAERVKGFFVPKLCNHCSESVCTQVCPVGASYRSPDGVVLVDEKTCVGCGYCVQACPYGTRFKNPVTHVADKCTLCYHRITKGLKPACVTVCPVGARMFGNLKDHKDEMYRILRQRRATVLKPEMGTHPKCYYIGLDQEVR